MVYESMCQGERLVAGIILIVLILSELRFVVWLASHPTIGKCEVDTDKLSKEQLIQFYTTTKKIESPPKEDYNA